VTELQGAQETHTSHPHMPLTVRPVTALTAHSHTPGPSTCTQPDHRLSYWPLESIEGQQRHTAALVVVLLLLILMLPGTSCTVVALL
jgi:hypothetical protein